MSEYTKISGKTIRTLDSNPKTFKQASISQILQSYKGQVSQRKMMKNDGFSMEKPKVFNEGLNLLQHKEKTNERSLPDEVKSGNDNFSDYNNVNFNDNQKIYGPTNATGKEAIVQQNMGRSFNLQTVQRMKAGNDVVASDLNHPQYNNIFKTESLDWYESKQDLLRIGRRNNIRYGTLVNLVAAEREQATHYKHWAETKNLTASNYTDLLSDSSKEHMYIHIGSDIKVANRDKSAKHPHTTLAEDDPDVICAGTFRKDEQEGQIIDIITPSSGHFKPTEVPLETKNLFKRKAGLRSLHLRYR